MAYTHLKVEVELSLETSCGIYIAGPCLPFCNCDCWNVECEVSSVWGCTVFPVRRSLDMLMSKVLMSATKHCRAEWTKSLSCCRREGTSSAAVVCLVDLSQEVCVGLVGFTEHYFSRTHSWDRINDTKTLFTCYWLSIRKFWFSLRKIPTWLTWSIYKYLVRTAQ